MKKGLVLLLVAQAAWGDADLLRSLEKSFSRIQTVQTRFTQEKMLQVFDRTIVIEGRLVLENPDRLAWRIDSPIRYVLVLDGDEARQWDEESGQVQKMKVGGDPVFEEVLGQIEKWFSGRFAELSEDYEMAVLGRDPLRMEFVPRTGSLVGKAIRRVTVSVRGDFKYVERIAIEDASGDRTTITFHDTVLNAPVAAAAWEVEPQDG